MTARRVSARPGDEGVVLVIVALLMSFVLLGIGALAVDLGNAFARETTLQNAADVAALAGAARLPDVDAARAAALASLCSPDNTVLGWSIGTGPTCEANSTWATSADPAAPDESDGEIEFYDGPAVGPDGRFATGQLTSGTAATGIRVVTPPATVNFNLAGGVPGLSNSLRTSRAATATAGTPVGGTQPVFGGPTRRPQDTGVLPFFLLLGEGTTGPVVPSRVCFVDRSAANVTVPSDCPEGARRGFVDEPQASTTNIDAALRANLSTGYDHPVHDYPHWPCGGTIPPVTSTPGLCSANDALPDAGPGATTTCADVTSGTAVAYPGAVPDNAVNCLTLAFGVRYITLRRGMLTDSGARLSRSCSGQFGSAGHAVSRPIDQTRLLDGGAIGLPDSLLNPDLSGSELAVMAAELHDGQLNTIGKPLFSSAIFGCDRLALLPRLQVMPEDLPTTFAAVESYPIRDFAYVWIGSDSSDDSDNGLIWASGNRLVGLRAYVIDPSFFPQSATVTDDVGPLVPPSQNAPGTSFPISTRLVRDIANPLD